MTGSRTRILPTAKPKRSAPLTAFARTLKIERLSASLILTSIVPLGPTMIAGLKYGTGVKFLRTVTLSNSDFFSAAPSSPPGSSSSGSAPIARLRVSRSFMRLARSTMKSGMGSSRCSSASASTAWSTIQSVTSPASGLPVSSLSEIFMVISWPGSAFSG